MKTIFLFIALCLGISSGQQLPRPFISFYAKGKEDLRAAEYERHKGEDFSKKFLAAFSEQQFNQLELTEIEFDSTEGLAFKAKVVSPGIKLGNEALKSYVDFFGHAFPEKTQRILDPRKIRARLYQFKGTSIVTILALFELDRPEFYMVNSEKSGSEVKVDIITKGAMSARRPSDDFLSGWEK